MLRVSQVSKVYRTELVETHALRELDLAGACLIEARQLAEAQGQKRMRGSVEAGLGALEEMVEAPPEGYPPARLEALPRPPVRGRSGAGTMGSWTPDPGRKAPRNASPTSTPLMA